MTKVKIVQIALSVNDQDVYSEYLDDKGRVWFPQGRWVDQDVSFGGERKWVTEWKQIELPDEPKQGVGNGNNTPA